MPPSGDIAVTAETREGRAWVRVENASPHAVGDVIERWLEPFARGRQTEHERIPGKGLGLYISRYIARSHGGDLTLAVPAEGRFAATLTLPASG